MPFDASNLDLATQFLIDARGSIEKGWCQNRSRQLTVDNRGRIVRHAVCMIGALTSHMAKYPATITSEATKRLEGAIGGEVIVGFNDAAGRTKEEVLAAFDRAIAGV